MCGLLNYIDSGTQHIEEWAVFQQIILEYLNIHESDINLDPLAIIKNQFQED